MISIIVAINENNAIGKDNDLLYYLPNDLKRFKTLTTGHTIIMGRRTFQSLPKGALPHRRNIVLTRGTQRFDGAECFSSLEEALQNCTMTEEIFVIGGASLYKEALPIADKLYLTLIADKETPADTYFPTIDFSEWELVHKEQHVADEKHPYAYTFADYIRK